MTALIDTLRGVNSQTASDMADGLPDIGDGLRSQLERLSRAPTPWECEAMASNLEGARRAVLRLREQLLREQSPK